MVYLDIVPDQRIVADHGSDIDDDPHRFRVTITFDEQADTKTVVTLRQIHPTRAQRDAGIGLGAVELGYQTLDKSAEHLRALASPGRRCREAAPPSRPRRTAPPPAHARVESIPRFVRGQVTG